MLWLLTIWSFIITFIHVIKWFLFQWVCIYFPLFFFSDLFFVFISCLSSCYFSRLGWYTCLSVQMSLPICKDLIFIFLSPPSPAWFVVSFPVMNRDLFYTFRGTIARLVLVRATSTFPGLSLVWVKAPSFPWHRHFFHHLVSCSAWVIPLVTFRESQRNWFNVLWDGLYLSDNENLHSLAQTSLLI